MQKLTFDIDPQTKERPRFSNGHAYTPSKTRAFENMIKVLAMHQRPILFDKVPVTLEIAFTIGCKDKKLWDTPHFKRVDLDNLIKALCDGLNGVCYTDDAQISKITASKIYGDRGNIIVKISQYD